MSGADSAKTLLNKFNHQQYRAFTLNSEATLTLPVISSVPGVGASRRRDVYRKIISHSQSSHHVKFISKNNEPHAFFWQTTAEKLEKAARWGIVKTHSITGKVIASLGQYRVVAHSRAAKGMVSNSQAVKLKLLDLFQDRFAALRDVESLVNGSKTAIEYEDTLIQYVQKLEATKRNLEAYFSNVNRSGLDNETLMQIKKDIQADIDRTNDYVDSLRGADNLRECNRARGKDSIMEFVKQQMLYGLYELQGINQDLTYSRKRFFALTRGELNDYIEDARKVIDDHQADLRNAVTAKHHGVYSSDKDALITYDFTDDQLTPAREREVLLSLSFIEGWDKLKDLNDERPTVSNDSGEESLQVYAATRWKNHRNIKTSVKSLGYYFINLIKSFFVYTHPWEEESWRNNNFHLVAADLRAHAKPNEPMWRKPVKFLKQFGYAMADVFYGVYDFGAGLVVKMPDTIVNDWYSAAAIPTLDSVLSDSSAAISCIQLVEDDRLKKVLLRSKYEPPETYSLSTSKLATVEYALNPGEQNDILTSMARGLNGFGSFFSHNIYAKDPVAGLLFTAAYAVGVGAIYQPSFTSSVFGSSYVNWFSNFSYTMGSSKFAAVIAGGSTQAEIFAAAWDSAVHGPSGLVMNTFYEYGEDPLTIGAYFVAAYGLGYILANGIAGHQIPWLSEYLKEDLGSAPDAAYPLVGAKVAILLYESLITEKEEEHPQPELSVNGDELKKASQQFIETNKQMIDRFRFAYWLSTHAKMLPKLEPKQQFAISRQIDELFSKEESESLHKLLYPEIQSSIAYQLFSIPLSYIPIILRFGVSLVLSFVALVQGKEHYGEPARRAAIQLIDTVKKDLSRLVVFASYVLYLPYTLAATMVKMTAYLSSMTIGRIAGLFDAKPGHYLHRSFATVHAFFRKVGEYIFPVRVLKDVAVAHPTHTIREVESSYVKLIKHIGELKKRPPADTTALDTQHKSIFSAVDKVEKPGIPAGEQYTSVAKQVA